MHILTRVGSCFYVVHVRNKRNLLTSKVQNEDYYLNKKKKKEIIRQTFKTEALKHSAVFHPPPAWLVCQHVWRKVGNLPP